MIETRLALARLMGQAEWHSARVLEPGSRADCAHWHHLTVTVSHVSSRSELSSFPSYCWRPECIWFLTFGVGLCSDSLVARWIFFEREAQGDVFVNCTVRHAGETLETKIDQDGVTNGGPGTIVAMGWIGWTSDAACTHVTALSPYNHYIVTYTPHSKF